VSVNPFLHFFFLLLYFFFFQIVPIEPSRLCRHPSIRMYESPSTVKPLVVSFFLSM
jgi:hypothetical protein